jgi:hypothetical protein
MDDRTLNSRKFQKRKILLPFHASKKDIWMWGADQSESEQVTSYNGGGAGGGCRISGNALVITSGTTESSD